jgi:endonuclease-8
MPEGPSLVILKELVQPFAHKKVVGVTGNSKVDIARAKGKVVRDFKSWGKHFLVCFDRFTIRIHFMLFGSYRINEERDAIPRLSLEFQKGKLNFYACSVKLLEEELDTVYDWSTDVMSNTWNAKAAKKKLLETPDILACDALLNQDIFAGSGNIIKNEVLFRIKVHPRSHVGALPVKKVNEMIKEVRNYSFQFLEWKKAFVLKKHWLAHTKRTCPRCQIPLTKEYLGKHPRRSFFCANCQELYE